MLANFFVLWLLLAVGGGFLLFFGGLLASWIGEEMACFLLATALLALAGALIIQLRERLQQTRRRLEEETDRLRRMEEKLDPVSYTHLPTEERPGALPGPLDLRQRRPALSDEVPPHPGPGGLPQCRRGAVRPAPGIRQLHRHRGAGRRHGGPAEGASGLRGEGGRPLVGKIPTNTPQIETKSPSPVVIGVKRVSGKGCDTHSGTGDVAGPAPGGPPGAGGADEPLYPLCCLLYTSKRLSWPMFWDVESVLP